MRVDIDYMKWMLDKVLDHNDVNFTWDLFNVRQEAAEQTDSYKKLVFHAEILQDMGFLEAASNSSGSIGFQRDGRGIVHLSIFPLRLTSGGHDFAAALAKKGVVKRIKSAFKDLGPREIVQAVFHVGKQAFNEML